MTQDQLLAIADRIVANPTDYPEDVVHVAIGYQFRQKQVDIQRQLIVGLIGLVDEIANKLPDGPGVEKMRAIMSKTRLAVAQTEGTG